MASIDRSKEPPVWHVPLSPKTPKRKRDEKSKAEGAGESPKKLRQDAHAKVPKMIPAQEQDKSFKPEKLAEGVRAGETAGKAQPKSTNQHKRKHVAGDEKPRHKKHKSMSDIMTAAPSHSRQESLPDLSKLSIHSTDDMEVDEEESLPEDPSIFLPEAFEQAHILLMQAGFKNPASAIEKSFAMYSRMAMALTGIEPNLAIHEAHIQKAIDEYENAEQQTKKVTNYRAMIAILKKVDDRAIQSTVATWSKMPVTDIHAQLKEVFSKVDLNNKQLPPRDKEAIQKFLRSSAYAKATIELKNQILQIDPKFLRGPIQEFAQAQLKEMLMNNAIQSLPTIYREESAHLIDGAISRVLHEVTQDPESIIDYETEGLDEEKLVSLIQRSVDAAGLPHDVVTTLSQTVMSLMKKEYEDALLPLTHQDQQAPEVQEQLIVLNSKILSTLTTMAQHAGEKGEGILAAVKNYQKAMDSLVHASRKEPLSPDDIALRQLQAFGFRDLSKLQNKEILGKGLFADIYQVTNQKGDLCVVKVLKKPISKLEWRRHVPAGEQLALNSDSEYVIKPTHFLYDAHDNIVGIVFPLVQRPIELSKAMDRNLLNEGHKKKVANQLLQGLLSLHRVGTAHLDLHADNILIDKDGNVRIIDFGTALRCDLTTREAIDAPPAQNNTALFDDCRRFAAHLYKMYEGKYPEGIPVFKNITDPTLQALIRRSLSPEPAEIPTLEEYLDCDLFFDSRNGN
jgi:hypothetical protein